jgi:hypothetical protein
MILVVTATYEHILSASPRDGRRVRPCTGPSTRVEGYAPHLNVDQATWLVAALPGETLEVTPVSNSRGFGYLPVHTVDGRVLRPQESSSASGPHLWLFQGASGEHVTERGELELDSAACAALKSAVTAGHHDVPNHWSADA